jgi:hypothetical protein
MLTIQGSRGPKCCDGLSRRRFLQAGTLAVGGLTMADVLRGQAASSVPVRPRSVIMVCQFGGPSHHDTFDMKPDAPSDIRGEFKPIATKVPGLQICELLPRLAQLADKFTLVKKLKMIGQDHYLPSEIMTGYLYNHLSRTGELRPAFGSVVSRVRASKDLPAYVSLRGGGENEDPQYLGAAHGPFVPRGPGLQNLSLTQGLTLSQLDERKSLLRSFDSLSRAIDQSREIDAMDKFTGQALEIITSSKVRDAFDVSKEEPRLRDRYGKSAAPYLQARRLAEAGVPVITLDADQGGWDTHQDNFNKLKPMLPRVDHGLSTLIQDIHERGLERDVLVIMWGEFGRSPKISNDAGRDHWPEANVALFAGGGMPMGEVIGATDAKGARPTTTPYGPQNVLATIYRFLGIDPSMTFLDHNGRPVYVLDDREPIKELI